VTDQDLSPAERYAQFRREQPHPVLADFRQLYDFDLDDFQVRACEAVEEGDGVLVAAPTGSGKTLVGEFAVHLALSQGRKAFYTTPIKALSNQKYADLVRRYGQDKVGLLTGDNTVNGEAPIVVMTTEVLRNMLYAGSRTLLDLGFVVMDEVHYLADRSRGAVWEEVIIHLPESVALISLSATVSNAEEFGEWLATVRGSTTTIVEETRPVPLYQHVMVGRRMYDLFDDSYDPADTGPEAKVNPELVRVARDDMVHRRVRDHRTPKGRGKTPRHAGNGRPGRAMMPSRFDVVDRLDRDGLLPAIYFIFSRVGCDAAVTQCLNANLRLTTPQERDEIFRFVEERCADLPKEDLAVLGYHDFLDGLTRGIAAHHAGMLPRFKECVEELFAAGRCRVVFATETLALGINMPARSVVLEKLVKWNGETHADISPGEYTQLTGRAGRRGIDVEGHGVVLWAPGLEPRTVAGLASTRTYPLRSSFRPSYNMAVNLVQQFGRTTARELLESSFAQFQADKAVVGLARQLRKAEEGLGGYAEAATCHLGDFMEYAALRRRLSDTEAEAAKARRRDRRDEVIESLDALRPGDVIQVPTGKYSGWALVVDPGQRADREDPRPYVLTIDRQARRLGMIDFDRPVRAADRMRVPRNFNGRNPQSRRDLASALKERVKGLDPGSPNQRRKRAASDPTRGSSEEEISRLRAQLRGHPCHGCDERESHARWAERYHKLQRETETLRRRIESRTNTIARQFDRICEVLASLGYLSPQSEVTESGRVLMRVYTELDLVVAESLRTGLWDGLSAPDLAAALSVLVYESRRADDQTSPRPPTGPVREVIAEMVRLWGRLSRVEKDHRVDYLREPDLGFAWAAQAWASGAHLDEVLTETDLAAGDFVRWMKQLLDLAGQVADAAPTPELRATARETLGALRHGVVAYSSLAE
jgi:ATP-dependent RNA helicase HelY